MFTNQNGKVSFSKESIAMIAGISTMSVYGVVAMASYSRVDGIIRMLRREQLSKGVQVKLDKDRAIVDLHVVLHYGVKVSVVTKNIITTVKYNIEEQTGVCVQRINLHIEGIRVQK